MTAIFGATGRAAGAAELDRMRVALARRLPKARRGSFTSAAGETVTLAGADVVDLPDFAIVVTGTSSPGGRALAARIAERGPERACDDVTGAWAFAAFDKRSGALWLGRDATGQRVLYVARTPGGLVFSSDTKSIHARGDVSRDLDRLALVRYLSCAYLPGDATLVRAVTEVQPGSVVRYDPDGTVTRRGFFAPEEPEDLDALEETAEADAPRYAKSLRDTLESVVAGYLESTADRGTPCAFLSGGVDSSLVVALAARLGQTPTCFSISFGDDLPNELVFSKMVADHVGASHEVVTIGPQAMADRLEETLYHLDDPIGDPLTVPNFLVAEAAASRGFRRALNGEGGDPCFGGPKNIPMLLSSWYDEDHGERERAYVRSYQKLYDDLPRLLAPGVLDDATKDEPIEAFLTPILAGPAKSFLNKLAHVNLSAKGGNHILVKVEKLYGAHGLVPLSPLFDPRVAMRAWETPPSLKLRGNVEKWILKQAVADVLPAAIIERKKSGMLVPVHPWLTGPLRDVAGELLSEASVKRRGLFEPSFVKELLRYQGAATVRGFYGAKIWMLLTLEAWMRLFLDGGAKRYEAASAVWDDGAGPVSR